MKPTRERAREDIITTLIDEPIEARGPLATKAKGLLIKNGFTPTEQEIVDIANEVFARREDGVAH